MENKVKVWLARDKDNRLFAYSCIPDKEKYIWTLEGNSVCMELSFRKFPSVKWEDDEPTEAYITLAEPQEQPKQEKAIDWEQRRYEIVKDISAAIYSRPTVKTALLNVIISAADTIIKELKKQSDA